MSIRELVALYEAGIISLDEARTAASALLEGSFGIKLDTKAE